MKNSQLLGRGAMHRVCSVMQDTAPLPDSEPIVTADLDAGAGELPVVYTPGHCRVCGCTELEPCDLGAGFYCWWVDQVHTLCSSPRCVAVVPLRELEREAGLEVASEQ